MKHRPITISPVCDRCKSSPATLESATTDDSVFCAECVQENDYTKPLEVWVCTHTRKCGFQGLYRDLKSLPDTRLPNVTSSHCPKCLNTEFFCRLLDGTSAWKPGKEAA